MSVAGAVLRKATLLSRILSCDDVLFVTLDFPPVHGIRRVLACLLACLLASLRVAFHLFFLDSVVV
jgi:hypothetical protein